MPFDSVFSPFLSAPITLNSEFASEFKVPFAEDEPILPRKEIEAETDRVSENYEKSIADLARTRILQGFNELRGKDEKAINRFDLNLRPQLSQLIWGLWSDGWLVGQDHGNREIDKLESESRKFNRLGDRLAEFRRKKKDKDRTDVFQPDDIATRRTGKPQRATIPQEKIGRGKKIDLRKYPLKGSYMEQAVRDRADAVSNWFSDDLGEELKQVMRRRAVGDPTLGRKLTDQEARDEVERILDGIEDEVEQGKTARSGGIAARAKRLAKTETTGVYTLGRLHSYKERGVRFARYHTFEYIRGLKPGLRPCMVCLPKNGHILDLETQWELIVTEYLIPAHPHCKCYWLPVLNEDGQALLAADIRRQPKKGVGAAIASGWMGFTVQGGRLVMNEALKREMERRERTRKRQKLNRTLMAGGAIAFSAVLYTFFEHWRRQQGGGAPGITITPEDIQNPVVRALSNVVPSVTDAEVALEKILAPAIIARLSQTDTPAGQLGVALLRSMGMNQQEAATAYGAMQMFLGYMKKHGATVVGGVDLNMAGVDDLMATGMFSRKKAEAIAAYTREGGKLDSLEDLKKVKFPGSRRTAFNTLEINRLQLYYARKNLNDTSLFDLNNVQAAEQLYQDLGVNRGTGEIILREMRQNGSYRNVGDMATRLKGKLDARTIKSVIQKLDTAGYKVVSPELDLMPRLNLLQDPALLEYPFPLTGTSLARSLPGAPPSLTSPGVPAGTPPVQAKQLRQSMLSQRPENLIQQAARVDRGVTSLLPKRLREQVIPQQKAAAQQARDRANQQALAYQRYSERVGDVLDATRNSFSPETIQGLIEYDPSGLSGLTTRVDGTLLNLQGTIKKLESLSEQADSRTVDLDLVYADIEQQIQNTEATRQTTLGQMEQALNKNTKAARDVKAQQESLTAQVDQYRAEALSRRDEFLDPQNYLRDSIQLNQVVQQMEELKDLQRTQVVQDLQVEIDQLRDLQASLIRDTQGVKRAIADEVERLRLLQQRIQQAQRAANLSTNLRDRLAEFWVRG